MNSVYILQGSTGEYSDRTDWIVAAYPNIDNATTAQQILTDLFNKMWKYMEENDVHYRDLMDGDTGTVPPYVADIWNHIKQIDPRCMLDYTGTTWWVKEVELR